MIYGGHQFTLIKTENKTKYKPRMIPLDENTLCGAQDLNSRVKIKFDDSYLVVDTFQSSCVAQNRRWRSVCLETNSFVADITDSKKSIRFIRLGDNNVLLEQPQTHSSNVTSFRLVAAENLSLTGPRDIR